MSNDILRSNLCFNIRSAQCCIAVQLALVSSNANVESGLLKSIGQVQMPSASISSNHQSSMKHLNPNYSVLCLIQYTCGFQSPSAHAHILTYTQSDLWFVSFKFKSRSQPSTVYPFNRDPARTLISSALKALIVFGAILGVCTN